MSVPQRRGRVVVGTVVALATLLGCHGAGNRVDAPGRRRLVTAHPARPFDPETAYRRTLVARWLPAAPGEVWAGDGGRPAAEDEGLVLRPDAVGRATVWRRVEADAALIDGVVVRTSAKPAGFFKLYWAPPERRLTADRSLDAASTVEGPDGGYESFFPLWRHPRWRGAVDRLRLTAAIPANRRELRITAVEAVGFATDPEALAQAAEAPRLLELDRELRPGLVAPAGRPIVWSTEVATGDRLTFGYGLLDRGGGRAAFRVRLEGESKPLFEAAVGRGSPARPGRWHDADLVLERDRSPARLVFECEVSPGPGAHGGLAFWSAPELGAPRPRAPRPNVLLVSLDTVRPDHLSLYGYERPTTPTLDRWSRDATVFEQVVTTAPWTLPAHVSMLTGLDAFHHGVNHRGRAPEELELLSERLSEAGYETAAITGGGYLDPEFGLHQGFASYRYFPERGGRAELGHGLRDALAWLHRAPREPWFLFFHTYEPHFPYHARQPFLDRLNGGSAVPDPADLAYVSSGLDAAHAFELSKHWRFRDGDGAERQLTDEEQRGLVDLYDSGLAYTDDRLGRLLEAAESGGRTIVVVTSDHGEALGERGLAGHAYLYDFNALVPLVVKRPTRGGRARVASQVRITDLVPTLLELVGLEIPPGLDGRSLVPLLDGAEEEDREATVYASFANRGLALRLGRRAKYLFNNTAWAPLWGEQSLFDLAADPGETRDLSQGEADVGPLARRAEQLADQVRGALRLSFSNPSARSLRGSIRGTALHPSRLASPRLPAGAVRWETQRRVLLDLPAGEAFDLLMENPPGADLRLEIEPDLSLAVDLDRLGTGPGSTVERWLSGGVWSGLRPAEDRFDARVTVSWTAMAATVEDPGERDAELREQLRALGYIE